MFSTKSRYALRILIDLAQQGSDDFVPLKDIAERQDISKKYLEIIAKDLVKGGLIKGASGKHGGYMLTRSPSEYSIGEIIVQIEGSFAPVTCLKNSPEECPRAAICKTISMWTEFYELEKDFFFGKKLSDLL